MAFTQVTVVGSYQLPDGTPVDGLVTFTPTQAMTNTDDTAEVSVLAPVVAAIVGGDVTASLAATDDADTTPAGTTYQVEVRSHRHSGLVEPVWWLDVPADAGTIDLATVEKQYVAPAAAPYLTRAVADVLYAPTQDEQAVDYTASFTPDTSDGASQGMSCTGNVTVQPPTGTPLPVLTLAFVASGADRDVTFSSGIRVSTGLDRGPHTVPSGEALFAALRWSGLLDDWVLVALTTTEA